MIGARNWVVPLDEDLWRDLPGLSLDFHRFSQLQFPLEPHYRFRSKLQPTTVKSTEHRNGEIGIARFGSTMLGIEEMPQTPGEKDHSKD